PPSLEVLKISYWSQSWILPQSLKVLRLRRVSTAFSNRQLPEGLRKLSIRVSYQCFCSQHLPNLQILAYEDDRGLKDLVAKRHECTIPASVRCLELGNIVSSPITFIPPFIA